MDTTLNTVAGGIPSFHEMSHYTSVAEREREREPHVDLLFMIFSTAPLLYYTTRAVSRSSTIPVLRKVFLTGSSSESLSVCLGAGPEVAAR